MFYEFGTPSRKIPMRERYFYTAATAFFFIVMSHIPLEGKNYTHNDTLSFMAPGTLMHIGMRPFAVTHIFTTLGKINEHEGRVWSLVLTLFMACQNYDSWHPIAYLFIMAYIIAHGISFLDVYGCMSLCTVLSSLDAAQHVVRNLFTWSTTVFILILCALVYLDRIHETIPLTHIRRRTQNVSMKIPLMFHSINALVFYSTISECIMPASVVSALFLYPSVYHINMLLPAAEKRTGAHLVRAWAGEHYFIPGWRSKKRMAIFVQRIIDRNLWRSTICTCVLWAIARLLYEQPTKYLLLMTIAKRYVTQRG